MFCRTSASRTYKSGPHRCLTSRKQWVASHKLLRETVGFKAQIGCNAVVNSEKGSTDPRFITSPFEYSLPVQRLKNDEVDDALKSLASRSQEWHDFPADDKIALLEEMKVRLVKSSMQLAEATTKVAGFGSPDEAPPRNKVNYTALVNSSSMLPFLNSYITILKGVAEGSSASDAVRTPPLLRTTDKGASVYRVQDHTDKEHADKSMGKCMGDVYVRPGVNMTQGADWERSHAAAPDGTALVLAGGNQPFLGFRDVLHCMFSENCTAALKFHDAQELTSPVLQYILQPLASRGFLKAFHCDVEAAAKATQSTHLCRLHMTGSNKTHEQILWGTQDDAASVRRTAGSPLVTVPFTSELGNVTPVFIVPGKFAEDELQNIAAMVAGNCLSNAGCNCLAPKAVILAEGWPQADEFEAALKDELKKAEDNPVWYPGALERYFEFLEAHPDAKFITPEGKDAEVATGETVPWAVLSVDLPDDEATESLAGFNEEFFGPCLIVARLRLPPVPQGISLAHSYCVAIPPFAQYFLWGDLVASVYMPKALEDSMEPNLQHMLDELQYGSIVVNGQTFSAFVMTNGVWGSYAPSSNSEMSRPGSGVGKFMNGLLLDNVQKQVLRYPSGHTVPPQELPVPRFVAKGLVGLIVNGRAGLAQAARR